MKLDVDDLSAGYGSAVVIRNVSFTVPSGSSLAILGRNGMGKTTLIKALLGYLPHAGTSVRLDDRPVGDWPTYRIVRQGIGYGPQDGGIFPDRTVHDNLLLGSLRVRDFRSRLDAVLDDFPVLKERMGQAAGTLSGGEQKMLILARTLVPGPRLLILDEISEGLQPSVLDIALTALRRQREQHQTTLILVEQSMDFALALADRVALLQVGEILFDRRADDPGLRAEIERVFAL
jgi:ABC-type branched-subunit amino acid transport system ATPase component